MRKVTIEKTIVNFDELTEDQKKKVIEKLRDINVKHFWDEHILGDLTSGLKTLGFKKPEISYSGFGSQGDGASFVGGFDIPKNKNEAQKRLKDFCTHNGNKNHQEMAQSLMEHEFSKEDIEEGVEVERGSSRYSHSGTIGSYNEFLKEWARSYSNLIYRELEITYFDLTSDEAIKETILANDYEFDLDTLEISNL